MAKRDSTVPVVAIEEPGDTAPIDASEVRRLLSTAPPPPDSERMRCPECFGLASDPPCATCDGRLLVGPATFARYQLRTLSDKIA